MKHLLPNPTRSSLLMLPFLLLLTSPILSSAQQFNAQGHYQPPAGNHRLYDKTKLQLKPPTTSKPDTVEFKRICQAMQTRVDAALKYLDAEPAKVKHVYSVLYGDTTLYNNLQRQLRDLRAYLADGTLPPRDRTFPDVPSPHTIESLKQKDLFTLLKTPLSNTINENLYYLYKNELLAGLIFDRYQQQIQEEPLYQVPLNGTYRTSWAELEKWQADLNGYAATLKKLSQDIIAADPTELSRIEKAGSGIKPAGNTIVQLFQKGKLSRQWLWYSGGVPMVNPLGVTEADRQYPATDKNSFMTPELQSAQDKLENSGFYKEFTATQQLYNKLSLYVENPKDDTRYELTEYDASEPDPDNSYYYRLLSGKLDQLQNKAALKLSIYNVPADQKVAITPGTGELIYQSQASQLVGSVLGYYLAVQGLTGKIPVGITALAPVFNSVSKSPTAFKFPPSPGGNKSGGQNSFWKSGATGKITSVKIGSRTVQLTGDDQKEDKTRLLTAMFNFHNPVASETERKTFLKELPLFLAQDVNQLDFADEFHLRQDIEKLSKDFDDFHKKSYDKAEHIKDLQQQVAAQLALIEPYIRVTSRSLPPLKMKASTNDNNPAFKTVNHTFKMPAAPALLTYVTTATGSQPGDEPREVNTGTIKVIETQKVDFSVGLAYTLKDYYISKDGTPPTVSLGDRFQFTAGVNWFVFGRLNKISKGIGPFKDRFSLYAGLSIANALDHYFLGGSYDVWPGIRPTIGWHGYKNYRFQVVNNTVVQKATGIANGGLFISINLEPATLIKNFTSN